MSHSVLEREKAPSLVPNVKAALNMDRQSFLTPEGENSTPLGSKRLSDANLKVNPSEASKNYTSGPLPTKPSGLFGTAARSRSSTSGSAHVTASGVRITAFPQDITLRILTFLPMSSLVAIAACSRRLKVLAYNEALYERKLRFMNFPLETEENETPSSSFLSDDLALARKSKGDLPIHIVEGWDRVSQSLGGPNSNLMLPVGMKGNQSREIYKRIHTLLWPYYIHFREADNRSPSSKSLSDLMESIDHATFLCLTQCFGRSAIASDFRRLNDTIVGAVQVFESQMLSLFDRSLEGGDTNGVRRSALCLFQLNGGFSCAQLFIYKSPIFYDHSRDVTENFKVLSLEGGEESPLQKYLNNISEALDTLLPRMSDLFPHSTQFEYFLVQKVFDECILDYLTRLLSEAQSRDFSLFLSSLTHMFEHCSELITRLSVRLDAKKLEDMLQACLSSFTNQYIDREVAHLKIACTNELTRWNNEVGAKRQKSIPNPTSLPAGAVGSGKASFGDENISKRVFASVKSALLTPGQLVRSAIRRNDDKYTPALSFGLEVQHVPRDNTTLESPTKTEFDELESLLSVDLVVSLISLNKESLKRTVVMMSRSGKIQHHVEKIFCVLLRTLGGSHISPSFNMYVNLSPNLFLMTTLEVFLVK
jgi:hypothetical protein